MITITAKSLKPGNDVLWTHKAKTDNMEEALSRAIRKHYGRGKWFNKDGNSSETRWIGQILKPYADSHSSVTNRICIDFDFE